ncbi:MAG: T9SS type A sorting domain-containing protein [Flavobacteriales bacterium]
MKTRLVLLTTVAAASIVAFISWPTDVKTSEYSPRFQEEAELGYRGAMEHYAMMKRNVETGEMENSDFVKMHSAVKKYTKAGTNKDLGLDMIWEAMGPGNYGGRTREVTFTDDGLIYAGGVSSGLYKSWDLGNTWFKVPGFEDNLNVTSIEQSGDGTLYVGTGSLFDGSFGQGGSGFVGTGVYYSEDQGETWLALEEFQVEALNGGSNDYTAVDVLNADILNSNKIWIGSRAGIETYDKSTGEKVSTFGGISFQDQSQCQDMVISEDGNKMLVVLGTDVYLSNDAGSNWQLVSGNSAPSLQLGFTTNRVGLAISPEDPNYVYALLTDQGRMGGVQASTDGGLTWFSTWPANSSQNENLDIDPFGTNTQGFYDLVLTVYPNDRERFIVGGVTLWEGGINQQPERIASNFGFGPNYVHSDIHHFEWQDDNLYIGTDGGVFISNDITTSDDPVFYEANLGYITTQFYGIGISTTGKVNGGTQDQSSFLVLPETQNAFNQFGGDGFDSDISKVDDNVQFVTSQYGRLGRSFDGGNSFNEFYDVNLNVLYDNPEENFPFINVVRLHENTNNPASQKTMTFVANDTLIPAGSIITFLTNNLNQEIFYELEEEMRIRDEVTYTSDVVVTVDSLLTETFTFTTEEYGADDFFFQTTIAIGLSDVLITLPNEDYDITEVIDGENVNVTIEFEEPVEVLDQMVTTLFNVPDTLTIIDPYSSLFAVATFDGVFVTRQALDANASPVWANILPGTYDLNCIEFSVDGNEMYVGTGQGDLFRVSNLNTYWSPDDIENLEVTRIFRQSGVPVMGVAIDHTDPDRIAIALGSYGGSGKVRITTEARTAEFTSNSGTFSNIWFQPGQPLAGMPCYDVCIPENYATGEEIILVATEFGVWGSNELNDPNSWVQCSQNIGNTPVFDIKQQWRGPQQFIENPTNTGMIYAGTHGRGIYRVGGTVGVEETNTDADSEEFEEGLILFPNPATDLVTFELELNTNMELNLEIYSIQGRLVRNENLGMFNQGTQIQPLYIGDLSKGNYIVKVAGDDFSKTGKLMVK